MKEILKKAMSQSLKDALLKKQKTQTAISKETGIATSTLNDYIKGRTYISEKNQEKIARALDMSVDTLFPKQKIVSYLNSPIEQSEVHEANTIYGTLTTEELHQIAKPFTQEQVLEMHIVKNDVGNYDVSIIQMNK
ncbi:helix-turn-helix domain-containing protein [Granulicatella sp. zg-ZJ]|uniref:helix-turn-helix domain-containing protein n=1 Tax=Granulicatella sp. zg-ZJ TaxID=2678504 RepID=UPI0013D6C174|nr:helix-turn-helix transcriptional regulator [Granulicatella sp. zg-ZJ]NEW62463.1 helix-turn-helix domain-containing protein [Granulicatella sp. zg-ZJ]NEW62465.1 helix-turn-helix domain-containing protein [Granulicatella sp. zg-ZJ]NEW63009.1 helix-turn-helix domain-containing protein [Granulicatella sp. zg-ZJ]